MASDFTKCNCQGCTLNGLPKVPAQLPENPAFPFLGVGQAPGGVEGVTGIPFTGPAGKMLWRLMKDAGLVKTQLDITNIVACPPPDDRIPTNLEQQCCFERLKDEIHQRQPKLIIAFGKPALEALTGHTGSMEAARGSFFDLLPKYGYECKVLANYHPSFVMRQRQWIDKAIEDLKLAVQYLMSPEYVTGGTMLEPQMELDPSYGALSDYLGSVREKDVTEFDLETTGLNPRVDRVLGISFCTNPEYATSAYLTEEDSRWELIAGFLKDKRRKKSAQNGSFDYGMLTPLDIEVENIVWDTRLAETLVHPDMPKNLQAMRAYYTKIPPYKPSEKEMRQTANWPKEKLLRMGCWDVITTNMVRTAQEPLMTKKELFLQQDLLIPLIKVFHHMMSRGIRVDVEQLAGLYAKMFPRLEAMRAEFDPIGLNPASPVQIKKHFGLRETSEDTLTYHIKRNDTNAQWYQKILDYRGLQKTMSTYLKGIYERLENEDRIYTEYKIEGTGTGRPSSSDPNLANVPAEMRVIYVPDDEEHLWCEVDCSQLELHVAGLVAPEPLILKELAAGVDIHEMTRKEIYGGEEKPRQRLITKAVEFGTLYGRSPYSVAREFGVSVAEATRWQAVCINRFPGFLAYKKRMDRTVANGEPLESIFGRRRFVQTTTQGYNTPVQSPAADVGLYILKRLFNAGFDVRITVYDSFMFQVPRENYMPIVKEAVDICQQPFEIFANNDFPNGYSFPVKAKVGPNWYNLEKVEI